MVETVAEAESILRQLWFGWFEGIYNQDEERIKEVVGTQALLDNARDQLLWRHWISLPCRTRDEIEFGSLEVLRSDQECLADMVEP